jgi:hypothetical protein
MKYEDLYQNLLNQIRNRIPQNSKLVTRLVDILLLEKTAVYRRLRQEVPFTFEEIAAIAKEFHISLDSMFGIEAKTTQLFRFQSAENVKLVEINYMMLDKYLQAIRDLSSDPNGEISSVSHLLPQLFYCGFKYIYQFYYFKWRYYSIPANQTISYSEITLPNQLIQIAEDIFVLSKRIKTNYFILNGQIFQDFVNDVIYFNNIRLIKDKDVHHIKDELFNFIDYMESIATNGFADDPENKVFIYISDTNIDTSYSYIDSKSSIRFALIWSFIFNSSLICKEESLETMKHRIRSIIRTSTPLSITGEKQRTIFFETQRNIAKQLGK